MSSPRCKPGDLAVVVKAEQQCNLGRIVRVVALHDGKGDLVFPPKFSPVWLVESASRMTWKVKAKGKRYRRKSGPAPDQQLQPIRGLPAADALDMTAERSVSMLTPTPT